ncbi:NADPH-dependent FMN reductase [Ovoidimarina sediminis]|uniref:NADPH-dependent FMN reductase n=1 Tax=Ovoidimarina sediminis TaxID=3079856 RepID=UPI00290B7634|nr:NAD(P)H-dependent oxidoreductase [Rhodophyticola sp. MJ-SS7]MDU8943997.1 NAD(P)H-dependent oxidoreductase [Rhodophyticola sp. MJ-SS7]
MLLCISGSLRAQSTNTKLAREAARLYGGPHEFGDIRLPLYDADREEADGIPSEVTRLAGQIAGAEAVVISSPEYNQSIPGGLKNALDWVSRTKGTPWRDKPVAIVSAAAGRAGGARASYALRLAMTPFRPRLLTGPEVLVADARNQFDAEDRLMGEMYIRNLTELMETLRRAATG